MINWIWFPKSTAAPAAAREVVKAFQAIEPTISSAKLKLSSNQVLAALAPGLAAVGYRVEASKRTDAKIPVPVLFGRQGAVEKSFDADAWNPEQKMVVEVEAGRGVVNNQFLKDLFQACMMHDVAYLGIAIRNDYRGCNDFERVASFFETLYASNRLRLPLAGILILGY